LIKSTPIYKLVVFSLIRSYIEERTLNGSIIITAQLPIKEWHAYLGNETIADAMMDRLIHTAHKIELKGPSMRELLANE